MSNGNHSSNGNGNGKVLPWVTGVFLIPIVMTVFGHLFSTTYQSVQRISVLEAEWREIKVTVDKIDNKIDRLLERK